MRKRESDPQVLVLRTGQCSSMLEGGTVNKSNIIKLR